MPSGKVHYSHGAIIFAITVPVSILLAEQSDIGMICGIGLSAGSLIGLFTGPDSDLRQTYSKRRMRQKLPLIGYLAYLWFLPFALGKHRGLSHTYLGTLMRWAWGWWIPAIALLSLGILPQFVLLFLLCALLGQAIQDTTHLVADGEIGRLK